MNTKKALAVVVIFVLLTSALIGNVALAEEDISVSGLSLTRSEISLNIADVAQDLTRAEVCRFLARSFGLYDPEADSNFPDVSSSHEYYHDISSLYEAGIVQGYTEGYFNPSGPVSRAAFAIVLMRVLEHAYGYDFSGEESNIPDISPDDSEYYRAISAAVNYGLMALEDGLFNPGETMLMEPKGRLVPIITPVNATNKKVEWSSDDESIAVVNSEGQVSAVGAGTTIIRAVTEDGDFESTCAVNVSSDPVNVSALSLTRSEINLNIADVAQDLTRAEVCRFLARSFGLYDPDADSNFSDVPSDHEYYHDISSLSKKRIVIGHPEGDFDPSGTVTRAEFALLLMRVLEYAHGYDFSEEAATIPDVPTDAWFYRAVSAVVNYGLMSLDGAGEFNSSGIMLLEPKGRLVPIITPVNAVNKEVGWSSDNPNVAVVDSEGQVTAVGAGTTIIRAVTLDGGIESTCTVNVSSGSVNVLDLSLTRDVINLTTADIARELTRAEACRYLAHSFGLYDPTAVSNFSDVPSSHEYYHDISSLYKAGIVKGQSLEIFNPSATVTRAEFAVLLMKVLNKIKEYNFSIEAATIPDVPTDAWFYSAVSAVVNYGIMRLDDEGRFHPNDVMVLEPKGRLIPIITPGNATNKKVRWSSDDESIAVVNPGGQVTGVRKGTTVVRAVTEDGSIVKTCTVNVSWAADCNTDERVDVKDLVILALSYGSNSSNPDGRWDERADLNKDGIINIKDTEIMLKDIKNDR